MKKYNLFKILGITFLFIGLLTWLIPSTAFDGAQFVTGDPNRTGIWHLLGYPLEAAHYFINMLVFVLVVGGFYGVLNKLDAYHKMLKKMASKFKTNSKYVLVVIMLIFALLAAFTGLSFELFVLVPFVMSLILLLGYDKMTGVSVIVGSIGIGMMGSLFGKYDAITLGQVFQIDGTYLLFAKIMLLVSGVALLAVYTLTYAKKIKGKKSLSLTKNNVEDAFFTPYKSGDKKKDGVKSCVELIVMFSLVALLLILGFMPWFNTFNVEWFYTIYDKVIAFEIFNFPIFGEIFGSSSFLSAFGTWGVDDISVVLLLATAFIVFTYRLKLDVVFDAFYEGVKKVLPAGLVVIFINIILVMAANSYIFATIMKWILDLGKDGFSLVTMIPVAITQSFGYVQMQYVLNFSIDMINNKVVDTASYELISLVFQSMYGMMLLFAPTSMVLIPVLAYTRVPYTKWIKYIWKLLLMLFGLVLIILILTKVL